MPILIQVTRVDTTIPTGQDNVWNVTLGGTDDLTAGTFKYRVGTSRADLTPYVLDKDVTLVSAATRLVRIEFNTSEVSADDGKFWHELWRTDVPVEYFEGILLVRKSLD